MFSKEGKVKAVSPVRVSYVILTYNRKEELKTCLDSLVAQAYEDIEIIVVDNNSQDGTDELVKRYSGIRYTGLDYNSGVCEGRNIGFAQATGDIIVVIDDDGEIPEEDFTGRVVDGFNRHPEMGIMALKIINPKDLATRRIVPSRDKSIADSQAETEVAYFLGGGVAFRRQVLEQVGYYPAEYFYSMEELDLSYRLARTSWKIIYFPQLVVLHHESIGQRPSWRRAYYDYRNRIWLATSFLPLQYLVVHLTVRALELGFKALRNGHFRSFARGTRDGIREIGRYRQRRKTHLLSRDEIARMKKLGGRVWY